MKNGSGVMVTDNTQLLDCSNPRTTSFDVFMQLLKRKIGWSFTRDASAFIVYHSAPPRISCASLEYRRICSRQVTREGGVNQRDALFSGDYYSLDDIPC